MFPVSSPVLSSHLQLTVCNCQYHIIYYRFEYFRGKIVRVVLRIIKTTYDKKHERVMWIKSKFYISSWMTKIMQKLSDFKLQVLAYLGHIKSTLWFEIVHVRMMDMKREGSVCFYPTRRSFWYIIPALTW